MTTSGANLALTSAQARMWAGQLMNPGSSLYNMALSYRMSGPLKADAFVAAFDQVVSEADALRMVIVEAGETASQRVLPQIDASMQIVDLSAKTDPAAAAHRLIEDRCRVAFDLTKCSFESLLMKLSDEDWIWYYNQHHIFTDASSFAVLFRRMEELYTQHEASTPLPLYVDHIAAELSRDPTPAAQEHFEARRGVPARFYGRSGAGQHTASDRVAVPVSSAMLDALKERTKDRNWAALTPQMAQYNMIATVLFAFLYRISGQTQLSLGAPVHNRATPTARRTAGLLIDVLPMAVEIDESDSFRTLFEKVRAETGQFLRHSTGGVTGSGLHRSYNAIFNFITAQFGSFAGMPTQSHWHHAGHCDVGHHLRLQVEDFNGSGALRFFFDLNTEVFPSVEEPIHHFTALFEAFLADPEAQVSSVPIITEGEIARVDEFGRGPEGGLETVSVPDLIAQQCGKTPDRTALSYGNQTVSYAQMAERVDRLAAHLQGLGVSPGARVAVVLPRGPAAVLAMIAIMRCGAAYVPIDPNVPTDRIGFICEDAGCAVTISLTGAGVGPVLVDEMGQVAGDGNAVFQPVELRADVTAYLLYTSGSTGKPKGVIVPHRGLSHYIGWARDTYCGDEALCFPLFSPLTFDLTVTSLFVPLVSGGTLRIYRESDGGVDAALLDVVRENVVDIIKLTPSHMRLLSGRDLSGSKVRQLIVGGEDFPTALAHELHDAFGGHVAMHNEYGPTEATVGCIVHTFDPDADRFGSVPIGRPISNMAVRILNAAGEPQPLGIEGELFLQGQGLADGYHNRPDLTEAAFVDAPDGSSKMYRTGDLARFRSDGVIEYLGRLDQQVKVNGVRIEAGEVEAALTAIEGVDGACVVLHHKNAASGEVHHCTRCGLPSNYPDVAFNEQGVCDVCTEFARYKDSAQDYFQDMPALQAVIDSGLPSKGSHDCVVLFSGGKDSAYMIGRLADMGLKVLAFTLDNGFISAQAKANIERVVKALGVDHIYGRVPGMNEIFADSLDRFANVCNGCFKTIYTLGMQVALDRNIPFVFTGLSRGQFFETRLTSELFAQGAPNAAEIDDIVLEARKAYHRTPDAVTKCLDMSAFETDEIFDKVRVVDFYRYCDVDLDALYDYLDTRLPWVRPSDTGRSTNCLINDAGIYVHKAERGYHNYALPYSWDVRMGVKERSAAMDELDDELNVEDVERILKDVGYRPKEPAASRAELIAYYTAATELSEAELKMKLGQSLPAYMLPAQFVHLDAFPVSKNGKIDRKALPAPRARTDAARVHVPARTDVEREMVAIWEDVLGVAPVGVTDDFFDVGGDSISAIRINTRARKAGFNLRPNDVFDALTIERLADLAGARLSEAEEDVPAGPVALMPAQAWFLEGHSKMPPTESQMMRLGVEPGFDVAKFEKAIAQVVAHHDGLRTAFSNTDGSWQARILDQAPQCCVIKRGDGSDAAEAAKLNAALNPETAQNIAVAFSGDEITIAVHHLVIDAVSWPILLEDVSAVMDGKPLPGKTASVRRWASQMKEAGIADVTAWQAYLNAASSTLDLPSTARVADAVDAQIQISAPQLEQARAGLRARGASLQQGMLAALALAFETPAPLQIAVEGMGRNDPQGRMDVARTLGWFTDFAPFALPLAAGDPLQVLKNVQSSEAARPIFTGGAEILRLRGALPEWSPSVLLNILDDAPLAVGSFKARGPLMLWRAPDAPLRHALSVNASLSVAGLTVVLSAAIPQDRLNAYAQKFEAEFARLRAALPAKTVRKASTATQKSNLDKLAALMGQKGGKA